MLLRVKPTKRPGGIGEVPLVSGLQIVDDSLEDHPKFAVLLERGAFEIVKAKNEKGKTIEPNDLQAVNVDDAVKLIAEIVILKEAEVLQSQELKGKKRKGVLSALEKKIEELTPTKTEK